MRIELPNGAWAILRDPSEVTERQRRPISRATRCIRPEIVGRGQSALGMPDKADGSPTPEKQAALMQLQYDMTNEEADAFTDATDLATVALVESWSFQQEPCLDGLLDLPGHALDALRAVTQPLVEQMRLDTSPSPNPSAPSGGSNGSATISMDAPQTTSLTSGAPSVSSD